MKNRKSLAALLLSLALAFGTLPVAARAAGSIYPDQEACLTVTVVCDGLALSGAVIDIYRIAAVDNAGTLTPLPQFQPYADALAGCGESDGDWQALAETLEREILLGNLGVLSPSDTALTDENGAAVFPGAGERLPLGLYLVFGSRTEKEGCVYATAPFFVRLPMWDEQSQTWRYSVTANAKPGQNPVLEDLEVVKIWEDDCHRDRRPQSIRIQLMRDGKPWGDPVVLPQDGVWSYVWHDLDGNHKWTVTEETVSGYQQPRIQQQGNRFVVTNTCDCPGNPDSPPILPQTGQLWWPVPVLLAAGMFFVILGLLRRRGAGHAR